MTTAAKADEVRGRNKYSAVKDEHQENVINLAVAVETTDITPTCSC